MSFEIAQPLRQQGDRENMSEFGVDFVVGRKKVTVAGAAKGSKDTLGHLFEHLVHLLHLAIDKTLFMVFVLIFP